MRKNIKSLIIIGSFATVIAIGYYSGGINVLGQNTVSGTFKSHMEHPETSEININEKSQTPKALPEETPIPTPTPTSSVLPVSTTESLPETIETQPAVSENVTGTNEAAALGESEKESRIVLLGDSMTEGLSVFGFFPETNIIGVNSLNTISALEQVDNVAAFKPTKLFILLGINDLWEGGYEGYMDDYINQYKELLTKIMSKTENCSIYIESVLPVSQYAMERNSEISNDIINEANSRVYKMTQELGINYIDVNTGLKDELGNLRSEYTNDGVHLINTYYPQWTDKLVPYMK